MDKLSSTKSLIKHFIRKQQNVTNSIIETDLTKHNFLSLISISRNIRSKADNRLIAEYISTNIPYFKELKDSSNMLLILKLADALNYEFLPKNTNVINYGEEADKFYILIEGIVGIYKPIYVLKQMKLIDYLAYMKNLRFHQNNKLKYTRINDKNYDQGIDVDFLKLNQDTDALNNECMVYMEEEEKLVEHTEPFTFGEIALIKKCNRNATIKTIKESKLISINKGDYNTIIREFEEKRLENQIRDFQKLYPLFLYWNQHYIISLFNCFSRQVLTKGEYLYKQNEAAECFYIIKSGTFEMYSVLSFGWIKEFFDYILTSSKADHNTHAQGHSQGDNIVTSFDYVNKQKPPYKEEDIVSYYNDQIQKRNDTHPTFFDLAKVRNITSIINCKSNDIDSIRKDQDEASNPNKVFKILLRKICSKEVVGIEDSYEVKSRFCYVKCISEYAEVDKVHLLDFLKIMLSISSTKNNRHFSHLVTQRKLMLFKQLKNGAIQQNQKFNNEIIYRFNSLPSFKPSEDTRLNLIKIADKQLFDYQVYKQEIISSLIKSNKKLLRIKRMKKAASMNNINVSSTIDNKSVLDIIKGNMLKHRRGGNDDNIICCIRDLSIVKRDAHLTCIYQEPASSLALSTTKNNGSIEVGGLKRLVRFKSAIHRNSGGRSAMIGEDKKDGRTKDVFLTRNKNSCNNVNAIGNLNKNSMRGFSCANVSTLDKGNKGKGSVREPRCSFSHVSRNIKHMLIHYNYNTLFQQIVETKK